MASELILPPGVEVAATPAPEAFPPVTGRGVIVNETDLPDMVVETYVEEHASVLGLSPGNSYSYYVGQGSLLARPKFRPPTSIVEEILLARNLAERDDDVGETIGAMVALAFGEGMQHVHPDEVAVAMWDKIGRKAKIILALKEMYREYLIAAQCTTATVMSRETIGFTPQGADRQRSRSILMPHIGVIPSEQIRVIGNDLFGTATLAYRPFSGRQEQWLMQFFNPRTTAARKAEMRREDPILTTLLTEQVAWDDVREGSVSTVYGDPGDPTIGAYVYTLNRAYVSRVCMPKGQWPHPRPLLTRNFPLLEAKRLLSIMDYSLLEAGANFLVVAKKGSDQRPALPEEIANLRDTIRRATRSGVMIGDHRLSIEVITPNLEELLNPAKRRLLGRKLATAILRLPDFQSADAGSGQSVLTDTEIIARVVASDREDLRLHVEEEIYDPIADRNGDSLEGPPTIWFPKIILQGLQYFTQLILGLRDRGDIPRRYAVEAAGFNYQAAVQQRKAEKAAGDDRVLTLPAGAVPFSAGGAGGAGGRPSGSGPNNGAPGARPSDQPATAPNRNGRPPARANEEVRAMLDEDSDRIYRAGERTYAILESYHDTQHVGRITSHEHAALARIEENACCGPVREGPFTVLPVNPGHELSELHAIRLQEGASMIVGRTDYGAVLARALVFREPRYSPLEAEETALRWGFEVARDAAAVA